MKLSTLVRIGILGPIALATIEIFSMKNMYEMERVHKEAAKYIAMQDYVPVGNGGALAVMNGKITPQRREMLNRIDRTYLEHMNCYSLNRVVEEADSLKALLSQ